MARSTRAPAHESSFAPASPLSGSRRSWTAARRDGGSRWPSPGPWKSLKQGDHAANLHVPFQTCDDQPPPLRSVCQRVTRATRQAAWARVSVRAELALTRAPAAGDAVAVACGWACVWKEPSVAGKPSAVLAGTARKAALAQLAPEGRGVVATGGHLLLQPGEVRINAAGFPRAHCAGGEAASVGEAAHGSPGQAPSPGRSAVAVGRRAWRGAPPCKASASVPG